MPERPAGYVPPPEPILDLHDIQGDILSGFNKPHQALIGIRIPSGSKARAKSWLARLLPHVENSSVERTLESKRRVREARRALKPKPRQTETFLNVAFSYAGLTKLAYDTEGFSRAFVEGQARRAVSKLGDPADETVEGSPRRWKIGGSDETTPDILLICGADIRANRDALRTSLIDDALAARLDPFWWQDGDDLPAAIGEGGEVITGREHFGFKDGIARLRVRGRRPGTGDFFAERVAGTPQDATLPEFSDPGAPLVWPGQILLGLARQSSTDPRLPFPVQPVAPVWAKNGSYLVFRRLRQNVPAFRDFVRTQTLELRRLTAQRTLTEERVAAMLVGRWPNGFPLESSPRVPRSAHATPLNNFTFMRPNWPGRNTIPADVFGDRCPLSAHIRKVNPRDQGSDLGPPADSLRRQMIRRGIAYGNELRKGARDEDDRGLLFLSFQASIEETFETIVQAWVNGTTGPAPSGFDMLLGQNPSGGKRYCFLMGHRLETSERFVVATGGGYFFAPSISAIRTVLAAK
jgi:Dyp-type peroxidase family